MPRHLHLIIGVAVWGGIGYLGDLAFRLAWLRLIGAVEA